VRCCSSVLYCSNLNFILANLNNNSKDLSEMPDTYGAPFDQNRAFSAGGWSALRNTEGDLSGRSHLHRIGLDHFRSDLLPSLTASDLVVCLLSDDAAAEDEGELRELMQDVKSARIACVYVGRETSGPLWMSSLSDSLQLSLLLDAGDDEIMSRELASKLLLNATSTYAQAFGRGCLFRGLMIAAGPCNDKIYGRCVNMIRDCCNGIE